MAEGITFNPTGTVTVNLDGKPYVLRRPKLREYRHHRDRIRELSVEAVEYLTDLRERLEAAEDDSPEYATLEDEISELSANTFEHTTIPWLKEAFDKLGDPLPDDHEEWPAWLATDQTLPSQIITHWRTVPLAPGGKGTN